MKFQRKIIATYVVLLMVLVTVFGSIYYALFAKQYKNQTYGNAEKLSNAKVKQLEETIDGMESVISYVLADIDVIEALKALAKPNTLSGENLYFDPNVMTVREKLTNYYLMNAFYRVIVFNKNGIVIANTNYTGASVNPEAGYDNFPWLDRVVNTAGRNILLGNHPDNWGNRADLNVISVIKEIQGFDMGYIEVQISEEMMENELHLEDFEKITATTKEGEILFSNMDSGLLNKCRAWEKNEEGNTIDILNVNAQKYVCINNSAAEKFNVLMAAKYENYGETFFSIISIALYLISVILFSAVYIYFTSRYLTRPIKQFEQIMRSTECFDERPDLPAEISDDEIGMIYNSYCDVIERLKYSLVKEKRMSILQLQSQFDLLQSQVNPHFIFNVLNILVERGTYLEDQMICDICSRLAAMLRYSTNTTTKYATLNDEKIYLDQYLSLQKVRFEHRLRYSIEIDDRISDCILPKIVLQQIVENAIQHGREKIKDYLEIIISGEKTQYGWRVCVSDNGCGIAPEKLDSILCELREIKKKLSDCRTHIEMGIGGMGLANTYARLYLLYNDKLNLTIDSTPGMGTSIEIDVQE